MDTYLKLPENSGYKIKGQVKVIAERDIEEVETWVARSLGLPGQGTGRTLEEANLDLGGFLVGERERYQENRLNLKGFEIPLAEKLELILIKK